MSLVKPLVRSLVQSLVKPLAGFVSGYYAALAAIGEKWPLLRGLIGSKGTPVTVTIASTSIYPDALGIYRKQAINEAAYCAGLYIDPAITNKGINYNLNPTDTTNVTDTGVTTTVVTPTEYPSMLSQLLADGDSNGKVYRTEYSSGANANASPATAVGNTNPHSIKVIARLVSGTGGALQLGSSTAAAPVSSIAITSTEWAEYEIDNITPAGIGNRVRLGADSGSVIEWIANMLTETATAPDSIIECAGSAGTQALDDVQVPTFSDNLVEYSEDFTKWTAASGASYSGGVLTLTADALSRISEGITASNGQTVYLYLYARSGSLSQARLGIFDNGSGGTQFTGNKTIASDFSYVESGAMTYGDGVAKTAFISNATPATAGTLEIDHVIVSTSPILPKYLETTGAARTTPEYVFPVNNCTYLIYLPKGLKDVGANQYVWDSTIDSNNWNRLIHVTGSNTILWSLKNTGVAVSCTASYTPDKTPLWIMVTSDSTTGKKLTLSNGNSDLDVSTADLKFHSTMQLGALNSLTAFMSGQVAYLTRFDEVITDINAAIQASEYGK